MTNPTEPTCTCTGTDAGLNACTKCPTPWPDTPGATRILHLDEQRERAEATMLAIHPEPEDACRAVEVDGETIRVRGAGPFTETDRQLAAEIVRAAKRKFDAGPVGDRLRQEIAGVLRDAPGRWNIRARTDAVMAAFDRFLDVSEAEAWCKTCRRVWNGPDHRCESDAEHRLALIRDAAALHRRQLIGSLELYAVIEAGPAAPDQSARTTANNSPTSKEA
ncbi:hypothetical protein [Streptomyces griseorubiginosus]|uniref:hypothetical protein n=1 Tax=Streptomyces griseorubiginosus TaxID=67304 RepID=UPI0036E16B9B